MHTLIRDSGAVVGLACAWAYCQKGFYRGTLLSSLGQSELVSVIAFCVPLVCCIAVLVCGGPKADRAAFGTPAPMVCAGTALGALGGAVVVLGTQVRPILALSYWVLLGFTCALAMLGWARWLVACAYTRGLPMTMGALFSAMLLARLVTSPLLGFTAVYQAEIFVMLPCSCMLWALFGRTEARVTGGAQKAFPLHGYAPIVIAFTVLGLSESLLLVHNGGAYELGFRSSSREAVLIAFLAAGCACQSSRLLARLQLERAGAWFLLFGLALGMPLGMLCGAFAGASPMGVALEFSSTVQALMRALLFVMAVLVAYETSASSHLVMGLALFMPLLASFALGSELLPGLDWLAGCTWIAAVLSMLFFVAMLAFIVQVNHSDAFHTLSVDNKTSRGIREEAAEQAGALLEWSSRLSERYRLTERETDVMVALTRGKTAKEIGESLFISPQTVYTHAKHIYAKLGIHSKQELVALAERATGSEPASF